MRIRTRLIIAFSFVAFVTASGLSFTIDHHIHRFGGTAQQVIDKELSDVTQANLKIAQTVLVELGESLVRMRADAVAEKARLLLKKQEPQNYEELRKDIFLRQYLTAAIKAQESVCGYLSLLDKKGIAIFHPNESVEGHRYSEYQKRDPEMWALIERSFEEESVSGYYTFHDPKTGEARKKYMVLRQVPHTSFIVLASVYIDEFFHDSQQQIADAGAENLSDARNSVRMFSQEAGAHIKITCILLGAAFLFLGLILGFFFARAIERPLLALCNAVEKVGEGDFSIQVPEKGGDEIAQLGNAFNRMGLKLTDYIHRLEKEVRARQAVESEIRIAAEIQESLLPRIFPPYPHRFEFDLYAALIPAKEVAGDFYDFFLVGSDRVVLVIGDVSGKGLSAALFMTAARTLLRNVCTQYDTPEKALAAANDILCQDNDTCMFVTVFLGYYEISTGKLYCANGGHPSMLSIPADGVCKSFGGKRGPALGVEKHLTYPLQTHQLGCNETVVFFTDGVTEATAPDESLFGMEGLTQFTQQHAQDTLKDFIDALLQTLTQFQAEEQFDDTTLLVFRRLQ